MEFLSSNSIYIVFIITAVIWAGIFLFLNKLSNRVKIAEELLNEDKNEK